jgi:transposase
MVYIGGIMFVRVTNSGKDGKYHYVQLVESNRAKDSGTVKTTVIHNFGLREEVDFKSIERLIESLASILPDGSPYAAKGAQGFEFLGSRESGPCWLLDGLWKRLGINKAIESLVKEHRYRTPIERMLFAMVAQRIVAPGSKLSIERWLEKSVLIEGLPSVDVHRLYAAMDLLIESNEAIQHRVFTQMTKAFDLDLDILLLDTTSTYFEIEEEDTYEGALRTRGHSKDGHPELAQVVVAFAVTKTGIPVRCWVWPGNTSDQAIVQEVKHDLGQWNLGRIIMVQDAGFNCERNRQILLQSAGDYIIGEKLRVGSKGEAVEALHRAGRYRQIEREGKILLCKDVFIDAGTALERRYVIVQNPEAATRDAANRNSIVAAARKKLEALSQLSDEPHKKAACELRSHGTYGRFIGQRHDGTLFIDEEKIAREALLDGKFLISTSLLKLPVEDVVYGYKQLFEVERVFRDLKHVVEVRPVYHRLDDRIRSHVLICFLAMVLVRCAERSLNMTWHDIMHTVTDIRVGMTRSTDGEVWLTSPLDDAQKELFRTLQIKLPPKIWDYKARQKQPKTV